MNYTGTFKPDVEHKAFPGFVPGRCYLARSGAQGYIIALNGDGCEDVVQGSTVELPGKYRPFDGTEVVFSEGQWNSLIIEILSKGVDSVVWNKINKLIPIEISRDVGVRNGKFCL